MKDVSLSDLTGTLAVVTGATSGIGFAIAEALVRRGVNVMIADIREDAIPVAVDALSGRALSGAALDAAARAYRVYYQKVPGKDGGPYLMDHSSIVYLLDRNGRFVTHFTHEAKAEAIAASVGRLL